MTTKCRCLIWHDASNPNDGEEKNDEKECFVFNSKNKYSNIMEVEPDLRIKLLTTFHQIPKSGNRKQIKTLVTMYLFSFLKGIK